MTGSSNLAEKIKHIADLLVGAVTSILDRYKQGKELSIVSIPSLDNNIHGLKKKKLIIVGGRPSQGKSTLLLQMATDFAFAGKRVVFFSLEMTIQVCIERIISNQCEIDNYLILTGELQREYDKYSVKINDLTQKLKNTNLILIESMGKTFGEIFEAIETFAHPVDAVFIDYVQMIKTDVRQQKTEAIEDYVKKLREYAIKKDFCAIIGSQINRGTHEGHKVREPDLWELKGSGALEESADVCMFVHWPWFYDRENMNEYIIRVAKNREGRTGKFPCRFDAQFYKISDYKEENIYARPADERQDRTPYREN